MSSIGSTTVFVDRWKGCLALELDAPVVKGDFLPSVKYCGTDSDHGRRERIEPDESVDGAWTFVLSPPIVARENMVLTHRYLVAIEGGDVYVRHPRHIVLNLVECGPSSANAPEGSKPEPRSWSLSMDGLGATVVMPSDFMTCESVQNS